MNHISLKMCIRFSQQRQSSLVSRPSTVQYLIAVKLSVFVCILYVIKSWMVEGPSNKARYVPLYSYHCMIVGLLTFEIPQGISSGTSVT